MLEPHPHQHLTDDFHVQPDVSGLQYAPIATLFRSQDLICACRAETHDTAFSAHGSALACTWASVHLCAPTSHRFSRNFAQDLACTIFLEIPSLPSNSLRHFAHHQTILKRRIRGNATPKRVLECIHEQSWRGGER
jgi:hypothetical protein